MFKETGHENAYFPLFVPKSLFEAEEKNAEGFAKECAIVTHYRLQNDPKNKGKLRVDPNAKLEEELIIRPTSEAIIWSTYKNWIQSYRDLPILINQWANVVRWEMRTRLFLRTAEFLWQEGHTAHETKNEAMEETIMINNLYADFAENYMSMPVMKGVKSKNETFAGAEKTYCIEALMQDGKALQAGTSHFLAQNFAKAFDVKFADRDGKLNYVWATSWGVSSRLMGALIMTHSDDRGLVLPPKLAPHQIIFVPIYKNEEQLKSISEVVKDLRNKLNEVGVSSKFDDRETKRPGEKFAQHEIQGVPVRITIGPKDLEKNSLEIFRRDTFEKQFVQINDSVEYVLQLLDQIQDNLLEKALSFRDKNITEVDNFDDFKNILEAKGGFISAHWDGTDETENKIKELTKATIRCIPEGTKTSGKCVFSGKPSDQRVLFAKAY
jgi:prolyl-tRNA synthetase